MAYVSALLTMFTRAAQQLEAWGRVFQIYLVLDVHDAAMDALYVDTPNSRSRNFPLIPKETVWGDPDIEWALEKAAPGLELRVGHERWSDQGDDRHTILIYSPRFGVPLEQSGSD